MEGFEVLDVGCGWDFEGEVNLDLFLHNKGPPSRKEEREVYNKNKRMLARHVPNFVCGDCNNLPFRDKSFETVACNHTLEHKGVDHIRTIKEMLRVTSQKIVIRVPSQFHERCRLATFHDKIFSRDVFHQIFRQFKRTVDFSGRWIDMNMPINLLRFIVNKVLPYHFPFNKLPCPVPTEITVTVNLV